VTYRISVIRDLSVNVSHPGAHEMLTNRPDLSRCVW